jgi:hypothetical protein
MLKKFLKNNVCSVPHLGFVSKRPNKSIHEYQEGLSPQNSWLI